LNTDRTVMGLLLLLLLATGGLCAAAGSESPLRRVTFSFTPDGQFDRVFLAGTFNDWSTDATEMRGDEDLFEVVMPLAPGTYQYKFVADGQWITDERAASFHPDGYGGQNSVIVVDDSFPPLSIRRGDGEILVDGLSHEQNAWERSLGEDGSVSIRVRTWMGDAEVVDLLLRSGGAVERRTARLVDSDGTYDYFEAVVEAESAAGDSEYAFRIIDRDLSVLLGRSGTVDRQDELSWFEFDVSSLSAFSTPDWVKEGVIYQIFPERFANGDDSNDPDFSEWYYDGVRELPASGKTNGEYFHLVDDWYDVAGLTRSPYKTDGKPDWNSFYGGDIEGIRQHLDYLGELGVTIIYLNPIFTSKSNHKYDAASYMEVDPHFSTNDEFAAFVEECHSRDIRVIVDLAINHTGHTFWAFVDAREKGPTSDYWDWYEWSDWPLPGTPASAPANPLDYYDCWWGFGQMPNLNFDLSRPNPEEQGVKDINEASPNAALVEHLLEAAEYWLVEMNVDGYRLDVAQEVPFWFWEMFRERVKAAKPEAYIVGELWGSSPHWVNGRYFDAVMNYKFFREPVMRFICRGESTADVFDRELAPGRMVYPEEGVLAQMNLLGSHDTERFLTAAGGDLRRLRLAALFSMTYVGVPTIYYGDEVGMEGGGDPDCRRPFDWRWSTDGDRIRTRDYVSELAALRASVPLLVYGRFETLLAEDRAYAYRRRDDRGEVVVVINAAEEEATLTVPLGPDVYTGEVGGGLRSFDWMTDLMEGTKTAVNETVGGVGFTVTLPPLSGSVYAPYLTVSAVGEGSY